MKKSTMTAVFCSDIQKVWDVVTDNENCAWRSDISKVETSDSGQVFSEYTKDGFPTTFTITSKKPLELYEFEMKNRHMQGRWQGIFSRKNGQTHIEFTEEVSVKNPIMNLFAKTYLRKQQTTYIADLRKALGEEEFET
jgi:hypothetical protein